MIFLFWIRYGFYFDIKLIEVSINSQAFCAISVGFQKLISCQLEVSVQLSIFSKMILLIEIIINFIFDSLQNSSLKVFKEI